MLSFYEIIIQAAKIILNAVNRILFFHRNTLKSAAKIYHLFDPALRFCYLVVIAI